MQRILLATTSPAFASTAVPVQPAVAQDALGAALLAGATGAGIIAHSTATRRKRALPAAAARPIIALKIVPRTDGRELTMMNVAYTLGRIFLPVIFIAAGVEKLLKVQAFAKLLADNSLPIPDEIVPYLGGIPKYEALGYLVGAVEVICGLMVLIGLKARWAALVLIVFTACTIFFVHHFWDMDAAVLSQNLEAALQNLSIMGGLLLLVAGGPGISAADRH